MWHLLLQGILNVGRHRRRSFLIASAVSAVVAVQVLALGALEAARDHAKDVASRVLLGDVNVVGVFKPNPARVFRVTSEAQAVEEVVRKTLPELVSFSWGDYGMTGDVELSTTRQVLSNPVVLIGLDVKEEPDLRRLMRLDAGSLSALEQPDTLLLSRAHARQLGLKIGDVVTLAAKTLRGVHNTVDVTVAAIAAPLGSVTSEFAFVPRSVTRALYDLPPGMGGTLRIRLPEGADVQGAQYRLREALAARGLSLVPDESLEWYPKQLQLAQEAWVGQKYDVVTWQTEFGWQLSVHELLGGLASVLWGVLLLIALLGVMNSLWASISERTQEVGALRAIGMRRRQVVWLFLVEGLALGVLGALGGFVLGAVLSLAVNALRLDAPHIVELFLGMDDHYRVGLSASLLWRIWWITLFLVSLSAFFPALRASRLRPVLALSHPS